MANTTPISNAQNIKLSILLDDPPATGADNGATASADGARGIWSATQRNQYLIESYRWLVNEVVKKYGIEKAADFLQGALTSQAITFSSSGVTLNKDFMFPFRLLQSTTTTFQQVSSRSDMVVDIDPFIDNAFLIENGKLYAWIRTAGVLTLQSSGTATFWYIGAPRTDTSTQADVAVNTAPDVTLDSRWTDIICDYAAGRALADKGDQENIEQSKIFLDKAMSKLP